MSLLGDRREAIAALITPPAGVVVTTDPAVGPPMILVAPARIGAPQGVGARSIVVPIRCVAAGTGEAADLEQIELMAEAVLAGLPGVSSGEPGDYRPNLEMSLPSYELLYPDQIPNPYC